MEPAKQYECSHCQRKDLISKENRACFRFDLDPDEDAVRVLVPETDETGYRVLPREEWRYEELTRPEFLEMLAGLETLDPDLPAFYLVLHQFGGAESKEAGTKEVCPTGLISFDDVELIDEVLVLEDRSSTYRALPLKGALEDQPQLLMELFDVVRRTKRHYESVRMEELKREAERPKHKPK